jgi:hypothetical protein
MHDDNFGFSIAIKIRKAQRSFLVRIANRIKGYLCPFRQQSLYS